MPETIGDQRRGEGLEGGEIRPELAMTHLLSIMQLSPEDPFWQTENGLAVYEAMGDFVTNHYENPIAQAMRSPMEKIAAVYSVTAEDGRYAELTKPLREVVSEKGLMQGRAVAIIEHLLAHIAFVEGFEFPDAIKNEMREIYRNFTLLDMFKVQSNEAETKHDVQAIINFVKEKISVVLRSYGCTDPDITKYTELVHIGCTSEDLNNVAVSWQLAQGLEIVQSRMDSLIEKLATDACTFADLPFPSYTHGQDATPITFGNKLARIVESLVKNMNRVTNTQISAKWGGATGGDNAKVFATRDREDLDWITFGEDFTRSLGFETYSLSTGQICDYSDHASVLNQLSIVCGSLSNACMDMWRSISRDEIAQLIVGTEVGSSAMPHKVNPIKFENASARFLLAQEQMNALAKLLLDSYDERDLRSSTFSREFGKCLANMLIAVENMKSGLSRISPNEAVIDAKLTNSPLVVSEAIQTEMRFRQYGDGYNAVKKFVRDSRNITAKMINNFIDTLGIADEVKADLCRLTPQTYIGNNGERTRRSLALSGIIFIETENSTSDSPNYKAVLGDSARHKETTIFQNQLS